MKIINLLHLYQPYNQQKDILDRIVNESYRPIVQGLLERPHAKLVINISGVLTQLLVEQGYADVVKGLTDLALRDQIELTGSAMYHAFLPLLPEEEVIRQMMENQRVNQQYLGEWFKPRGFFPPEMAISAGLLAQVKGVGYEWVAAPQVAMGPVLKPGNRIYQSNGVSVMFRNKRVSELMLSGVIRSADDLLHETEDLHKIDQYWFTVMDGETFGHHRIGHQQLLFEILDSPQFQPLRVVDLLDGDLPVESVELRASTWTNQEQDFWLNEQRTEATDAKSFILWRDPENPIHTMQWQLTELVIKMISEWPNKDQPQWVSARQQLDPAIASDQYWWASAKPWWSLEMIEQGAHALRQVVTTLQTEGFYYERATELYRMILDQAFEWQRSGHIRQRHLSDSSTYMKEPFKHRAPAEWYNQIMLEFEDEMNQAAEHKEFEKAIKWRDALIKIKQGTDIYDVLHVVDELWTARSIPELKPFIEHRPEEISKFVQGFLQPLEREEGGASEN